MKLDFLLGQDPKDAFLFLERKVNSKFPLSCEHAKVREHFRADLGADSFGLPFVFLSKKEVELFESSPSPSIKKQVVGKDKVKFFVHPEMIDSYLSKGLYRLTEFDGHVDVSPTSSTRTLLTHKGSDDFMVKIDLEKRLGNRVRKMKRRHLEQSSRITKELASSDLPLYFAYMPESLGVLYSDGSEEVGMIIREFERKPVVKEKRYLLPFFSLFSLDKEDKTQDPLLAQIVQRGAKKGHEYEFFHDNVLRPFLYSWGYFVFNRGLSPDIHSQNCLLEIDCDCMPKRVVYRDFQEFFVDPEMRNARNLSLDFKYNVITPESSALKNVDGVVVKDWEENKRIRYSIVYDYTIGTILDYFSVVLSKFASCRESKFVEGAKSVLTECFDGMQDEFFPKKAYHLKSEQKDVTKMYDIREAVPKYR